MSKSSRPKRNRSVIRTKILLRLSRSLLLTAVAFGQMDFSKTIVIQPGSRWLRMGRSTDPT
jgi:hypothetical protein